MGTQSPHPDEQPEITLLRQQNKQKWAAIIMAAHFSYQNKSQAGLAQFRYFV